MSAHYTKPGLPTFPTVDDMMARSPDGGPVEDEAILRSKMVLASYGQACYDAGRADHVAEVGPMAPLTQEQGREIAMRFTSLRHRVDLVIAVIRATENAHGIATPKEAL